MASLKQWVVCCIILTCVNILPTQAIAKAWFNYEEKDTTDPELDIIPPPNNTLGICKGRYIRYRPDELRKLNGCRVIVGNLGIALMEYQNTFSGYVNPTIREITGHLLFYRLKSLFSISQLFPNLARIRGTQLVGNYALIVYDMMDLEEVGLYNLLKIDRGGVIVHAKPTTCYIDKVNWNAIAPRVQHVIDRDTADGNIEGVECTSKCTCTDNYLTNHCWNNKKCQRFIEGPDAEVCHKECLGCKKTNAKACTVCRNFTFGNKCVSSCPNGTYPADVYKYCLTEEQCNENEGWLFNKTCVLDCPLDFKRVDINNSTTCEPCPTCAETCHGNILINTLTAMEKAQRCAIINGSLTVQLRTLPQAMAELRAFLDHIKEVKDYVHIQGSQYVTSLDFLSALKTIGGRKLKSGTYSLVINDMVSLSTLFKANVTKNMTIKAGTVRIYNNPMLCKKEIDKIKHLFPIPPSEADVPEGMNGYGGGCSHINLSLAINNVEEHTAVASFKHTVDTTISYSLLYTPLLPEETPDIVPESCSGNRWSSVNIDIDSKSDIRVTLPMKDLIPASKYVMCIESYDESNRHLTRSATVNFTTKVGRPIPPFLTEVVAMTANSIAIHWVNHIQYTDHTTHFELDVILADLMDDDVNVRNHCENPVPYDNVIKHYDYSPHAVVKRPPEDYEAPCETLCGILSRGIKGAMVQEDFDPCSLGLYCEDALENGPPENITFSSNNYYQSVSVKINGTKREYEVGGLAPYRDYRVRLRACTEVGCSRSSRRFVRTKALVGADMARITGTYYNDGDITIKWEAPELPNGPVLTYLLQVKPKREIAEVGYQIPEELCVTNAYREATVSTIVAASYKVRVCTTTLVQNMTCTEWTEVVKSVIPYNNMTPWWLMTIIGMIGAIAIFSVACFLSPRLRSYLRTYTRILYTRHTDSQESIRIFPAYEPIIEVNEANENNDNNVVNAADENNENNEDNEDKGDKDDNKSQPVEISQPNPFINPIPGTSKAALEVVFDLVTFNSSIGDDKKELKSDETQIVKTDRLETDQNIAGTSTTSPTSASNPLSESLDNDDKTTSSTEPLMEMADIQIHKSTDAESNLFPSSDSIDDDQKTPGPDEPLIESNIVKRQKIPKIGKKLFSSSDSIEDAQKTTVLYKPLIEPEIKETVDKLCPSSDSIEDDLHGASSLEQLQEMAKVPLQIIEPESSHSKTTTEGTDEKE